MLESESNQEHENDKFNRVDMLAELGTGELAIIEVQNSRVNDYFQRILYGTSKLITEYIDIGDDYIKVKKVYSVSIVYFGLGQGEDYAYHGLTRKQKPDTPPINVKILLLTPKNTQYIPFFP
jgi:predicted transposase/invertase (TIGR01784 family)